MLESARPGALRQRRRTRPRADARVFRGRIGRGADPADPARARPRRDHRAPARGPDRRRAGFFQHAFVEIEAMPGGPRIDVYDDEHEELGAVRPRRARSGAVGIRSRLWCRPAGDRAARRGRALTRRHRSPRPLRSSPPHRRRPPRRRCPRRAAVGRSLSRTSCQVRERGGGPSPYVTAHLAALARVRASGASAGAHREPVRLAAPRVDFQELLAPRRTPVEPLGDAAGARAQCRRRTHLPSAERSHPVRRRAHELASKRVCSATASAPSSPTS